MFLESHIRIMYSTMNIYQREHRLKGSDPVFTVSAIVLLLEREKQVLKNYGFLRFLDLEDISFSISRDKYD